MELATFVDMILSALVPVGLGTMLISAAFAVDVWARKRSRVVRRRQEA